MVRAVAAKGALRAVAATTTRLVEEARRRHGTSATATAALGRALTAAVLLSAGLKDRGRVTVRVAGDGPLSPVVAEASVEGHVRGYLRNPTFDLSPNAQGKLDVAGGVGRRGTIHVVRDLGLKEPYVGSSPLVSGLIAEDLTYFLHESDQTRSACALGVLVDVDLAVRAAGGFLVEALPPAEEEAVGRLEGNLVRMASVSALIDEGKSPEDILTAALEGLGVKILGRSPLEFRCRCSRDKARALLAALGEEELRDMLAEGRSEMTCRFCNERYLFSGDELAEILESLETS